MGNFPGTQEQPGQTSNNQTIKNALIKIKKIKIKQDQKYRVFGGFLKHSYQA